MEACRRRVNLFVAFGFLPIFLSGFASAVNAQSSRGPITKEQVNQAQQAWCDGLVAIGRMHAEGKDYRAFAAKFIDDTYDFAEGRVFFKPTLAIHPRQFRKTREGTLSYFVGGNPEFPEDNGFALAPWVKVRYDNAGDGDVGIQIHGEIAVTMGNVYLTDAKGNEIMVDKTFVFRRGSDGRLRLIVHKSALPFSPAE